MGSTVPARWRPTLDSNNLQDTLYRLLQSDSRANLAYATLVHDYNTYHAVLFIEAGMFALMLVVLSLYFWRRVAHMHRAATHHGSFEQKTYIGFGLLSAGAALFLLLLVAANLSVVVTPHEGFAQVIPELGVPQAGTRKAALYQEVNTWVQSGRADLPPLLQGAIDHRLAWQRPKAIVCSILLVVFALFTARVWQRLLQHVRTGAFMWSLREQALLAIGVLAVPLTLLLMLMALANTQASLAPITLTLLFS